MSYQMIGDAPFKKSFGELSTETKGLVNKPPRELDLDVAPEKILYQELEPNKLQFERSATSVFGNDESSFNIVVLGPTGCGKSTIINQLFNRTVCTTSASASSVTQELKFFHGNLMTSENDFKKTTIIDTIGKLRSYKKVVIWYMDLNFCESSRWLNLMI